ncbi:TPA: hypothetical protein ACQZLN_000322 [Klebsiella pneumoniae]|uniref:hypothetical protein n=1 Tax=Klebsiella pneumoniae TaxID=573 RepID=UPI0022ADFA61|nr:hypothetical protein [Klebsiella pneumoniae]
MSEFSRETLLNIIETDHVQCGEASALARMALAAMDSEPVIVVGDDGGDALSYRRLIQSFESGTKLYRHAQPAQVVPDEKDKTVDADDHPLLWSFNEGWNACRAAMLAAATHDTTALNSIQSVDTVADRWIPVSEQKPDCWCLTCRSVTLNDMRFVVCPDCGNKRCPRANDHRNACTGSNEPGQEGSAYSDTPREVKP